MTASESVTFIGGWAQLLTPIMLMIGTILGIYQLRVSAKARRLQALASIYQQLRPIEIIEIEQGLLHDPTIITNADDLSENDKRKIDAVISSYQRLGYLLYQKLVTEEELLPMVGWESLLLWEKLKGYIRTQVREDVPHARAHFEYLASRANDYIKKGITRVIPEVIGFDADMDELRNIIRRGI